MFDDFGDAERVAAGASELLIDFGAYLTGGKRPSRALVWIMWLFTLGGALALWHWFAWLFDHLPGWAVLAGGSWILVTVVTIGLAAAAITHGASRPPSRPRRKR
jgi:hypothetical protein